LKKYIPAICTIALFVILLVELPFFQRILSAHAAPAKAVASATPSGALQAPSGMSFVHACSQAPAGSAGCMAMMSTTTVQPTFATPVAHPMLTGGGATPAAAATGSAAPYGPTALHNAYNLPMTTANSKNQTVAIVDAFDDPNAEMDLATYRSMFGLPACTTANGCFKKVNQNGAASPLPSPNAQWAVEISLDLDTVSAICTDCKILLVEANTNSFADLGAAVNTAAALGATAVSNSYGGTEAAGNAAMCSQFYNHPGVVVTASSGDASLSLNSPANCPNVVAVGGTTLNPNGTETAWNAGTAGAGGGCSAQIPLPTWQMPNVTNCPNSRAISDVSAVADPNTGVFVEDTFQQGGGLMVGGTSVSAPLVAAVYALAGGTPNATSAAMVPWANSANGCLNPVGGAAYGFQTGLGSPNGLNCF
jgi:subtilase family serine protease